MWTLAEVADEVWRLIVDASLDEVCREEGLTPSRTPRGWVPGVPGSPVPSEGLTEPLAGEEW